MTKREAKRIGFALGITALILVLGFFFITGVSLPLAEIVGLSPAENIRHFTRFRIVPPEWISSGPDGLYWSWMKAESITRLSIILTAWLLAMIFVNPYNQRKEKSSDLGNSEKDRQMNRKTDKLFRGLLLVAIIFVLAVIAINFVRSRKMTAMEACIANMKQLEGAREQALLAGQNASTSSNLLQNTDIVSTNKVSR